MRPYTLVATTTSSRRAKVPDRAAEDFFTVAKRIAVRGVEEIDTRFKRLLDEWSALLLGEASGMITEIATAIAHAAEADAQDDGPKRALRRTG